MLTILCDYDYFVHENLKNEASMNAIKIFFLLKDLRLNLVEPVHES
jgi:hypothetical protein